MARRIVQQLAVTEVPVCLPEREPELDVVRVLPNSLAKGLEAVQRSALERQGGPDQDRLALGEPADVTRSLFEVMGR